MSEPSDNDPRWDAMERRLDALAGAIERRLDAIDANLSVLNETAKLAEHCVDPEDRRRDEVLRKAVEWIERLGRVGRWLLDRPTYVAALFVLGVYWWQAGAQGIAIWVAEVLRRIQ